MVVTQILTLVGQAEQFFGSELAKAVLGFLKGRFADKLSPEDLALLVADEERLQRIIAESQSQLNPDDGA